MILYKFKIFLKNNVKNDVNNEMLIMNFINICLLFFIIIFFHHKYMV